jgi:hypothetical protein
LCEVTQAKSLKYHRFQVRPAQVHDEQWNSRRSAALLIASLSGATVKSATLIFMILGIVVTTQACAEPISNQPLTRIDCDRAGLSWNDNANVCGSASEGARTLPKPATAERSGQPLTRADCDKARMRWNDKANVCGEKSGTQAASKATSPVPSTILINIDKAKQQTLPEF